MAPTWGNSKKAYEEACKEYEQKRRESYNQKENKEIQEAELYVVRGAKMICSCGSHKRKINLPISHGSYIKDKPMMTKLDYTTELKVNDAMDAVNNKKNLEKIIQDKAIDKFNTNIPYFGLCSAMSKEISLEIKVIKEETGESIIGQKCYPTFKEPWKNYKEDMLAQDLLLLNEEFLTTKSKIVCYFGGTISFYSSGQEEEVVTKIEEIKPKNKEKDMLENLDISDDIVYGNEENNSQDSHHINMVDSDNTPW